MNQEMTVSLKIIKFLSEQEPVIMEQIHCYRKIALFSPMATGKTFLITGPLRNYAKSNDLVLVIVNPSVTQGEQMEGCIEIESAIKQGVSYNGEKVVVSTPESLYKVMDNLLENEKKFILVFDEAHEKVTSINFRKKIGIVEKYEKYAEKVVYMTATPEPLFNEGFDVVIDIEMLGKEKIPCKLIECDKINTTLLVKQIESAILRDEKVILCNDNKMVNKKIYEALVDKFGAEYLMAIEDNQPHQLDVWEDDEPETTSVSGFDVVSSQDRTGQAYKDIINEKWPVGLKVLITTSFIKAGLNINNPDNTRMILTINKQGFMLADKVQQMGRLRNKKGIVSIDILTPHVDIPKQYGYQPIEQIMEHLTSEVNSMYHNQVETSVYVPSDATLDVCCAVYDTCQEKYVIDSNRLSNRIYSTYCKQLLTWHNRFKIDLERQSAISLDVEITSLESVSDAQIEASVAEMKKDKKKAFETAKSEILKLDPYEQETIIMVEFDKIKALNDKLKPIAEAYHLNMSTTDRTFIGKIRKNLTMGDKLEAHLKFIRQDKKEINLEYDAIEVRKLNNQFLLIRDNDEKVNKTIRQFKSNKKKLAGRVYFIRYQLQDLESKQGRLSKKRLNLLAQQMIDEGYYSGKKINLEKAFALLNQDLDLIYTFKYDKKGALISKTKY